MKRRQLIALFGWTMAAWVPDVRAQERATPVVGYLYVGAAKPSAHLLAAFRKGLAETGYREGSNVTIEYRFADNRPDRLPALVAELVRQPAAVIVTPSSLPAALSAKAATTSIPIVFNTAGDPIQAGLVASLDRPGGNVTGISSMTLGLTAERVALLVELVPGAETIALLVNPNNQLLAASAISEAKETALRIGRRLEVVNAGTSGEIDRAFAEMIQRRIGALMVSPDVLFSGHREQLVALAARYAIPTIYSVRELPEAGGLMSYGPSLADQFRQAGIYAGRILNGEKPANLPVLRATKYELLINLRTARQLGLEFPAKLIARADEIIR